MNVVAIDFFHLESFFLSQLGLVSLLHSQLHLPTLLKVLLVAPLCKKAQLLLLRKFLTLLAYLGSEGLFFSAHESL